MNQHELNREVARATGESVETIEAMGFSVLTAAPPWVVDHRARLRDHTRRKMRRRLKARKAPARKVRPKTRVPKIASKRQAAASVKQVPAGRHVGTGGAIGGGTSHRIAARAPEWRDSIIPFPHPQIRQLNFEKWRA